MPPPDNLTWPLVMEAFRDSGLPYPRATVFVGPVEGRMRLLANGRFLTTFLPVSYTHLTLPTTERV